jgi:hypothetical protein
MQFDRMVGGVRVVNAGSVGSPFNAVGAFWLLLGEELELKRTEYDFESAAAMIRATTYPMAAQYAVESVIAPPGEEQTLAWLARAELL